MKKRPSFISFLISLFSQGQFWFLKILIISFMGIQPVLADEDLKELIRESLKSGLKIMVDKFEKLENENSIDPEAIADIANKINVRIEGGTQGSGVLVKKQGNIYTVLTSWHVIKDNTSAEEVGIITFDGKEHIWDPKSLRQVDNVDIGFFTFKSKENYQIANFGNLQNVSIGNKTFVAGFPLPSSSIPIRLLRFTKGEVIANANANAQIPDGYKLIYSNNTFPGMSGGSVLNSSGELIGIHGRAEGFFRQGEIRRTGTNQGVPITFYQIFNQQMFTLLPDENPSKLDNLVISFYEKGNKQHDAGNFRGALGSYTKAIKLNPNYGDAYYNRAVVKEDLGRYKSAISDYDQAINLNPTDVDAFYNRGFQKQGLGDYVGALSDYDKAIELYPMDDVYFDRGLLRFKLGDFEGGCRDWQMVRTFTKSKYIIFVDNRLKKLNRQYKNKVCQ
ncbi:MAG: tetratricopeptide repeat-containing serine protease family protein [Prochlorococcus marinus XMU1425]|nr:tetratricopeptide repeat-containing serine protease family protein [Prochlorococcus marinus XMU1425]MCR8534682.1 tetratricopeptide repeat-containing serine protease family protein [Prochlorococcus marinus XMU1426]